MTRPHVMSSALSCQVQSRPRCRSRPRWKRLAAPPRRSVATGLQQLLCPFACYRDARATASEQTRMSAQASNAYRRMSGSDDAGSSSQHAYTEPIKEV